MSSPYLTSSEVMTRLKISKATLHRRLKCKNNPFPKPALGGLGKGHHRRWDINDVLAWEQREAQHG